jgi:hypothetical protein
MRSNVVATNASVVLDEIRTELRSILRQKEDLHRPLEWFGLDESRPEGDPRYYILFDQNPRLVITGIRLGGLGKLTIPDERIIDRIYDYAKSVWHLKDRLKTWAKIGCSSVNVEAKASKSRNLLICADLANWKKHGDLDKPRSGLEPCIRAVTFDTSQSGGIEQYYDGATKRQEVLVAKNVPIPYHAEVVGTSGSLGDAVQIIDQAFQDWLPVIQSLGVLTAGDKESDYLRERLFGVGGRCSPDVT